MFQPSGVFQNPHPAPCCTCFYEPQNLLRLWQEHGGDGDGLLRDRQRPWRSGETVEERTQESGREMGKGRKGEQEKQTVSQKKTMNSGGGGEIPGIEIKTKERSCC